MLHVPLFAQRIYYALLDRSTTCTADGDTHLVVAAETIEFVVFLSGVCREFHFAGVAVEVVRMVGIAAVFQHRLVDHHVAFLAEISSNAGFSFFVVALATKGATSIPDKAFISKRT